MALSTWFDVNSIEVLYQQGYPLTILEHMTGFDEWLVFYGLE